jgi:proline iminopeptidase
MASKVAFIGLPDGARLWTQPTTAASADLPMVFVHGGPGMWDYLGPVAEMVEDLITTHRFHQRGCGRHPRSRTPAVAGGT